jgi:hypothetical protein
MNTWLTVAVLIVCVMTVGYVEDPCTTEGLMQGCMQKWLTHPYSVLI